MFNCLVCNNTTFDIKRYNNHVLDLSFKGLSKTTLKYLNPLIPSSWFYLKNISSRHKGIFSGEVRICKNCGYGCMEDIPSDNKLEKYYNQQYWRGRGSKKKFVFKGKYKNNSRAKYQVAFILRNLNKDSLIKNYLDIGAAHASSSLLFRDCWENNRIKLFACELGEQWSDYYEEADINHISNKFPFSNSFKFDFIHTSHWLEHVNDLVRALNAISSLNSRNGYLFIEVPNTEHFYWDYPQTDTPHIHFFTRKSLTKILKSFNYKLVAVEEAGETFEDIFYARKSLESANQYGCYIRSLFRKTI